MGQDQQQDSQQNSQARTSLQQAKRWVVKIGSALLTADGKGIAVEAIADWVAQMATLRSQGVELVLVSSGAVAEGLVRLGLNERPSELYRLQAAAAVGQMGLVRTYEDQFKQHGLHTAQILLTHDDLANRERYLNARSTVRELLALGIIPVINENDTVVTDEIRFGDNDSLGALVANLVEADALVILTDQLGLHEQDPRQNPAAPVIATAQASDSKLDAMVGGSAGHLGRGGMLTKLKAARLAARSGTYTVIAGGMQDAVLTRLRAGDAIGTLLVPDVETQAARKQWLAGHLQAKGTLVLDDGATKVLKEQGKSLLPVGVAEVKGQFNRGDMVLCCDGQGHDVARGLVNYSSDEAARIIGQPSDRINDILGYASEPELIHRDNLIV